MTELDEAWEVALAQATQRAQGAGRADIARYLDLRRRNDLLRRAATEWLLDAVFSLAADANRAHRRLSVQACLSDDGWNSTDVTARRARTHCRERLATYAA